MKLDSHPTSPKAAFTLIELLIVVAIIAILAAIAVPNFLEAQTRSKVSRVKADIRTVVTAIESYFVDNNKYPPTPYSSDSVGLSGGILRVVPTLISTPVAYVSTASFTDPFLGPNVGSFQYPTTKDPVTRIGGVDVWAPCPASDPCIRSSGIIIEPTDENAGKRYYYQSHLDVQPRRGNTAVNGFINFSIPSQGAWVITSLGPDRARDLSRGDDANAVIPGRDVYVPYDPTNGTVSEGDIVRTQKQTEGTL